MQPTAWTRDTLNRIAAEQLRYEPTCRAVEHWLQLLDTSAERDLPDFDPVDAPGLLAFIYILERDGDRLRYRVSGESVNQLFGANHGGKYLDQVVPALLYPMVAPYFLSVFDKVVCIFKSHVILSNQQLTEFERVLLPVRRGGQVQLLGTLSLSTSAKIRRDRPAPPVVEPGFHFTQIDLATGDITESRIPHRDLPIDHMPFELHAGRKD